MNTSPKRQIATTLFSLRGILNLVMSLWLALLNIMLKRLVKIQIINPPTHIQGQTEPVSPAPHPTEPYLAKPYVSEQWYLLRSPSLAEALILQRYCKQHHLPRPQLKMRITATPTDPEDAQQPQSPRENTHRTNHVHSVPVVYLHQRGFRQLCTQLPTSPKSANKTQAEMNWGTNPVIRDRLCGPHAISLIPVSFFWGRAPGRTNSLWKLLFSESWKKPSALKKALRVIVHGRECTVSFGQPLATQTIPSKAHPPHTEPQQTPSANRHNSFHSSRHNSRQCRRLFRLARIHFRQERTAAIGPDLSHRRQIAHKVLSSAAVRASLQEAAAKDGMAPQKLKKRAQRYVMEIASDYAHSMVRAYHLLLSKLWHQLYDGLAVHHIDRVQAIAGTHTLIYVPCHRSHMDYLLLPFLLYDAGLAPPHTAAGINLNLPLIGRCLRHGGAFFLRRQFKGNALYASVFQSYLAVMLAEGLSLAFFIEGGRSRSGRLLPPKLGMMHMILKNYAQILAPSNAQPIAFVPVYIGYEKLFEGNTYLKELNGLKKKPESIIGLLRALRGLRNRFGQVHIQFGDPICPAPTPSDAPEAEHRQQVQEIGHTISARINDAAVIADINLLSLALLAAPRHALDDDVLIRQLSFYQQLLSDSRCSINSSIAWIVSKRSPSDIIVAAEKLGLIQRQRLLQGDIILTESNKALLLTYFRNNCIHTLALSSLLACALETLTMPSLSHLLSLIDAVMPMICEELSINYDKAQYQHAASGTLRQFEQTQLINMTHENTSGASSGDASKSAPERVFEDSSQEFFAEKKCYQAAPSGSPQALMLTLLGNIIRPSLERYLVTLTVIRYAKASPDEKDRSALVQNVQESFQRLAVLAEFNAPEFFEKKLVETLLAGAEKLDWLAGVSESEHTDHSEADAADRTSGSTSPQQAGLLLTPKGETVYQELKPIVGASLLPLLNLNEPLK